MKTPDRNTTKEIMALLRSLKLSGMADALEEMDKFPQEYEDWSWRDRIACLVHAQDERRFNNKVKDCHKRAKLRYPMASLHDILVPAERNLDLDMLAAVSTKEWLEHHDNIVMPGASGCGKTYLACAVGAAICNLGIAVRYSRTGDLLRELADARLAGTYEKTLKLYVRAPLLILDEFLLSRLTESQTADLLNLVEERYQDTSLLLCTQYPIEEWTERLCVTSGNQPICEAILDRIIHSAHLLEIGGSLSMRERLRKMETEEK